MDMKIENIKDFYNFYVNNLQGKMYCYQTEVPSKYHYETEDLGYDHIGHLGFKTNLVVDKYKMVIKREPINIYNVFDCIKDVLEKKAWIEDKEEWEMK